MSGKVGYQQIFLWIFSFSIMYVLLIERQSSLENILRLSTEKGKVRKREQFFSFTSHFLKEQQARNKRSWIGFSGSHTSGYYLQGIKY